MNSSKQKATSKRNLQLNNSYYGRHVQKSKIGQVELPKATKTPRDKRNEVQIAHRREHIIGSMRKNRDRPIIRIEDNSPNLFFSTNAHPEAESLWLKKIAQMRQRLDFVSKKITDQEKISQQRQRELQEKKLRHGALLDKYESFKRKLQQQTIQDEQERLSPSQQLLERRFKEKQHEQEINSLKEDQKVLVYQTKQMQAELKFLQKQYRRLESAEETEQTVEDLNEFIEENERIKQSIQRLESDNFELQQKINQLESTSKPTDELYRRFAELYEKMIMGREMQKFQKLLQVKEYFLQERDDYERNKIVLKEKKKEMSQIEKRIQDKEKQVKKLTQEIVDISNQLLLLYHDGS